MNHETSMCSIVTKIRVGHKESWFSVREGQIICLFSKASSLALRASRFPMQWLPGPLSLVKVAG